MAVGLAVIGVLLLALPAVMVLLSRRLPSPRLRPVTPDPYYELARRHRLHGADFVEVEQAVAQGRLAEPARLRPAAADQAALILGQFRPKTRFRKVQVGLFVVWLALLVPYVVRQPVAAVYLVMIPVIVVLGRRARRRYERAFELNSAAVEAPEYDTSDGG